MIEAPLPSSSSPAVESAAGEGTAGPLFSAGVEAGKLDGAHLDGAADDREGAAPAQSRRRATPRARAVGDGAAAPAKADGAYRTISEVATELGLGQHVLRFWEVKFPQLRPMKRGGGRRYYRPEDVALLRRIDHLLHKEGYTIKGAQRLMRTAAGRSGAVSQGTSSATAPAALTERPVSAVAPSHAPVVPDAAPDGAPPESRERALRLVLTQTLIDLRALRAKLDAL